MSSAESQVTAAKLYFLACREAYRPGKPGAQEKRVLHSLQRALAIPTPAAQKIAAQAFERARRRGLQPEARFDISRLVRHVEAVCGPDDGRDQRTRNLVAAFRRGLSPDAAVAKAPPAAPAPAPDLAAAVSTRTPIAAPPAAPAPAPDLAGAVSTRSPIAPPRAGAAPPPGSAFDAAEDLPEVDYSDVGGPTADELPPAAPAAPPPEAVAVSTKTPVASRDLPAPDRPVPPPVLTAPATVAFSGKKVAADSGGGDEAAVATRFGDPAGWGLGRLFSLPIQLSKENRRVWVQLGLLHSASNLVPVLLPLLLSPLVVGMTMTLVDCGARGEAPESFGDLWRRTLPAIPGLYYTSVMIGLVGALVSGGVVASAMAVGALAGQTAGFATLAILGIAAVWYLLHRTLFAMQIAAVEGRSGYDALRGSTEAIAANKSALIGGDAIALILGVSFGTEAVGKLISVLVFGVTGLAGPLGSLLIGFPLTLLLMGPLLVYRNATWAALYLRGRPRPQLASGVGGLPAG